MLLYPLQFTKANTFVDYIITANAEALGYIAAGVFYPRIGGKKIIVLALSATALFSFMLMGFTNSSTVITIFISCSVFTLAFSTNVTYLITFESFPTAYISFVFGML